MPGLPLLLLDRPSRALRLLLRWHQLKCSMCFLAVSCHISQLNRLSGDGPPAVHEAGSVVLTRGVIFLSLRQCCVLVSTVWRRSVMGCACVSLCVCACAHTSQVLCLHVSSIGAHVCAQVCFLINLSVKAMYILAHFLHQGDPLCFLSPGVRHPMEQGLSVLISLVSMGSHVCCVPVEGCHPRIELPV